MSCTWIIHRDPRFQAALARLVADRGETVVAAPGDPALEDAPGPHAVVLGLAGSFEVELQFAHRTLARLPGARWVLVAPAGEVERARSLFDSLDCSVLAYPPEPRALRAALGSGDAREPLPLSQRPARDLLASRFSRWFADLELPELLRILDPHLVDVPVLIRGEPGTGRGLLARYIHTFGGTDRGGFVHVPCEPHHGARELAELMAAAPRGRGGAPTIWLENADLLPDETQRVVAGWIDFDAAPQPWGAATRWIVTAGDDDLSLSDALATAAGRFGLRIPPLRERPGAVGPFAAATARAWCERRRERARRFGDDAVAALEAHVWPLNLRELETVTIQALIACASDPIGAADLPGPPFPAPSEEPGEAAEATAVVAGAEVPDPPETPPAETEVPAEAAGGGDLDADVSDLRRLVGAVAHEVRNPLTTIRTFAELLPAQYRDSEFREQFSELVGRDVDRIDAVVRELANLAALPAPGARPVDSTRLIEELLDQRREWIQLRKLLVLKELERDAPLVLGDAAQLRVAFDALFDKCIDITPERGDLYLASRHHAAGLHGRPSVRVLVRFQGPRDEKAPTPYAGLSPAENALEFAIAGVIVRAHQGVFTVQTGEGGETVLVLELPAPA